MRFEIPEESVEKIIGLAEKEIPKPIISLEELEKGCEGDEDLEELLGEMLSRCLRYTESVARYKEVAMEIGEADTIDFQSVFRDVDELRSRTHDVTVDSINIISRELTRKGKNSAWINQLAGNRAAYGRFAITLTFSRLIDKR